MYTETAAEGESGSGGNRADTDRPSSTGESDDPLDDSFAQKLAGWVRAKGGRLRILSSTQPAALAAASAVTGASAAAVTHQSALNPIFRGATAPERKEQCTSSS